MFIALLLFAALASNSGITYQSKNDIRRSDMARISTLFIEYMSNNAGKIPQTHSEMSIFVNRYLVGKEGYAPSEADWNNPDAWSCVSDSRFCDPDGTSYMITMPINASTTKPVYPTSMDHKVYYYTNARCGAADNERVIVGNGIRDIAVIYYLGNDEIYCADTQ